MQVDEVVGDVDGRRGAVRHAGSYAILCIRRTPRLWSVKAFVVERVGTAARPILHW